MYSAARMSTSIGSSAASSACSGTRSRWGPGGTAAHACGEAGVIGSCAKGAGVSTMSSGGATGWSLRARRGTPGMPPRGIGSGAAGGGAVGLLHPDLRKAAVTAGRRRELGTQVSELLLGLPQPSSLQFAQPGRERDLVVEVLDRCHRD